MTDLPEQHTVSTLPVIPDSLFQCTPAAPQLLTKTVKTEEIRSAPAHHFHINCFLIGSKTDPALPADMMFHLHNQIPALYKSATHNNTIKGRHRNGKSLLMYTELFMFPAVIERQPHPRCIGKPQIPELHCQFSLGIT